MSPMHGAAQPVLTALTGVEDIIVPSTGVVYTEAFKLYLANYFGLWCKLTGATGDVKVEFEQSYKPPTTEGAAETALWVVPDGTSAIFTQINDELAHIKTISPVPMNYGRFKLTGLGSNPAGTTIKMFVFLQEDV